MDSTTVNDGKETSVWSLYISASDSRRDRLGDADKAPGVLLRSPLLAAYAQLTLLFVQGPHRGLHSSHLTCRRRQVRLWRWACTVSNQSVDAISTERVYSERVRTLTNLSSCADPCPETAARAYSGAVQSHCSSVCSTCLDPSLAIDTAAMDVSSRSSSNGRRQEGIDHETMEMEIERGDSGDSFIVG